MLFIFKSDCFYFFFSLSFFFEGEASFLTGSFQGSEHLIGRRKVALDLVSWGQCDVDKRHVMSEALPLP